MPIKSKNPQANSIIRWVYQALGNLLHSSKANGEISEPGNIKEFVTNILWAYSIILIQYFSLHLV